MAPKPQVMGIERQRQEEIIHTNHNNVAMETHRTLKVRRLIFLFVNIVFLLIGGIGGPLLIRAYFRHGGNRKWFSGFLQTAGFPFLLIPIIVSFLRRRRTTSSFFLLTPPLFLCCAILGLITGVDDFLYSYGVSFLPVSTASLLLSTQLGFTTIFAFFIVKQKFSSFTVNAIVLLTFSVVALGVNSNGDLPNGEPKGKYYIGFVITVGAAIIYGLVLPLMELMYMHARQPVTYALVMEMQFIIGFFATIVCAIGMTLNKDFQAISSEGKHYGLGEVEYYLVVFFTTITGQFFFLGLVGTIKYSSALLGGIIIALCIPVTEILAIFFFHEKFDGNKGVALALSLWGTASYFCGEYEKNNKSKVDSAIESQHLPL